MTEHPGKAPASTQVGIHTNIRGFLLKTKNL
jgi:hypothetical protein